MEYKEDAMRFAQKMANVTMGFGKGGPFGAAIVRESDGKIIVVESNSVLAENDPTAHAEINAIRSACKKLGTHDLTGYTLVATGYPCPMCMSAIIWANIKTVKFAAYAIDAELIGFRDDYIYQFIKTGCNSEHVLKVEWAGPEYRNAVKMMYENYSIDNREVY